MHTILNPPGRSVHSFLRAAIRKFHRLRGLNRRNVSPPILEAGSLRSRCQQGWFLLSLWWGVCSRLSPWLVNGHPLLGFTSSPLSVWWWWGFNHYVISHSCDHMDCSSPGSSVHGILQVGILESVAISFSRGSSWLRNRTWVSCIADRFFTNWAKREAPSLCIRLQISSSSKDTSHIGLGPCLMTSFWLMTSAKIFSPNKMIS